MTAPAITARTRRLHAAILRGDEDRAADHARYLARWAGLTRPVTLPEPCPRPVTLPAVPKELSQ